MSSDVVVPFLIHQQRWFNSMWFALYRQRQGAELTNFRNHVSKTENYCEVTVPNYTLEDFRSHFRMTRSTFENLCIKLHSLGTFVKKNGPNVDMEKNLLMCFWYIGNLESFRSMADRFGVSKSTFHDSIRRTSNYLINIMHYVIRWPTERNLIDTSAGFSAMSQFQNVISAVDGSHIQIKAPSDHPEAYYNRKKFYSVILLASCNSQLEFNYVWTGNPWSTHDATVLRQCDLYRDCDQRVPPGFYLLGDSAFPILHLLITPFRDCGNLTPQQRLFNKVHSKCRQVIERAFGLLKCRFRRLLRLDASDMSLIVDSILSACVLYNLCLDDCYEFLDEIETEPDNDDQYTRQGHELQGIRLRQQLMEQLLHV